MNTLELALSYARRGWRVIPTDGAKKYPRIDNWQIVASNELIAVAEMFTAGVRDIAIVTGRESGIFVLDVDPRHGGDDTLAELELLHGKLPQTPESITGSLGRHLFFAYPIGKTIRNNAATRLGPGLDIRGDGGQVSAPPTRHANGNTYEWELSADPMDIPVADAPEWMLELLTTEITQDAPHREKRELDATNLLPGQRFEQETDWADLLELHGASYVGSRDGEEFWSRPALDHEHNFGVHTSATLYYKGSDVLKVFTSSWEGLTQDETYTRFGFYTALQHGGDHEAAAAALGHIYRNLEAEEFFDLIRQGDDDVQRQVLDKVIDRTAEVRKETSAAILSWKPVSLADVADQAPEQPPEVGRRDDDVYLFYRGKVNTVFGDSEGMKSWFTQVVGFQAARLGQKVLIIDFENSRRSVYDRYVALGATRADLEQIDIIKPETPFGSDARDLIEQHARERDYRAIVVDGTTDAMALFGLEPDKNSDTAKYDRGFLKPLAATGAAVIFVDHVVKAPEARNGKAIGGQHKRSLVDGAAFEVIKVLKFGKGLRGVANIFLRKDKMGDLGQFASQNECIAELHLDSDPETFDISFKLLPPRVDGQVGPNTNYMGRIAEVIEKGAGKDRLTIITEARLSKVKNPDQVTEAFNLLETLQFIADDIGSGRGRDRRWRSLKPFDEVAYVVGGQQSMTIQDAFGVASSKRDPVAEAQSADRLRKKIEQTLPRDDEELLDADPHPKDVAAQVAALEADPAFNKAVDNFGSALSQVPVGKPSTMAHVPMDFFFGGPESKSDDIDEEDIVAFEEPA